MAEKPYLSAAFLCERVLLEKDEVLTAVRIVDTFYVSVPKNLPPDAKPTIQLTVLLSFKKVIGDQLEKHQATLHMYGPSGEMSEPPPSLDFYFKADEVSGSNLILNLGLPVKEFGTHRIDVLVDGDHVTTIPFRLLERPEEKPAVIH